MQNLPIIDLQPALTGQSADTVADEIGRACRETGFFYISGHGIREDLQVRLEEMSHRFFALEEEEKLKIRMELGGKAWRGYFPVGNELTSGKPDQKEGIYFGQELPVDDDRVKSGLPMHGPNLFPESIPGMKRVVLEYMTAMEALGHELMRLLSLSLGLDAQYFHGHFTCDPITLFRIFHYPPTKESDHWGVGEHTDYGVLTILKQDNNGGLQVNTPKGWIEAPPIENTFICNIGDMLDKLTGGLFRSTPHRVVNRSGKSRTSWPFFFDPNWNARISPVYAMDQNTSSDRWDGADLSGFQGTYGDYLLGKVSKVFPELFGSMD